jgi:hypothetical protein
LVFHLEEGHEEDNEGRYLFAFLNFWIPWRKQRGFSPRHNSPILFRWLEPTVSLVYVLIEISSNQSIYSKHFSLNFSNSYFSAVEDEHVSDWIRNFSGPVRGKDVVYPLNLTLEDLYNGVTKKMKVTRNVICKTCDGKASLSYSHSLSHSLTLTFLRWMRQHSFCLFFVFRLLSEVFFIFWFI